MAKSRAAKENFDLDEYLSESPQISGEAKYWFFRTEGGSLFEPFITSQSIAIGHPSISLSTLQTLPLDAKAKKSLAKAIAKAEPDEERPGLAASQLLRFVHEIKNGDYVVIPSAYSSELCIGRVAGRPPFEEELVFQGIPFPGFVKRRAVKWLKRVKRDQTNPNLYRVFYAHQTLTDITDCAQWIDILLFNFFKKGDEFHYVLEINKHGGINARDLFESGLELFQLADEFAESIGLERASRSIETKLNLNSPGDWELITSASKYIFVVGAIVLFLNGGGFKLKVEKLGLDANLNTDGLIKKISDFLNDRKRRQMSESVTKKLDAMQVQDPAELLEMIERINKKK